MKVAISGSTGYLGFKLVNAFLRQGVDVLAITRNINDKLIRLSQEFKTLHICESVKENLSFVLQNFSPNVIYSTTCCYETDSIRKTIDANYNFLQAFTKFIRFCIFPFLTPISYSIYFNRHLACYLNLYSPLNGSFQIGEFIQNKVYSIYRLLG